MDRYAVVGNPIAHSLSPRIHRLFAEQTGQVLGYEAILAPRDGFAATVNDFRQAGGRGLNVTLPFKQEAFALADTLSGRARAAGAVNTLIFHADGSRDGDNTDGTGLINDLTGNLCLSATGRSVLILGAGGAVRGILAPLLSLRPAQVVIANRTPARAHELARRFASLGPVDGRGFDALDGRFFDLIVNGTSAGLDGAVPDIPDSVLAPGGACYDMVYAAEPTPFVRWARARGAAVAADGLGMLVEQAAESFLLWRGLRPDTAPVIRALRP